MNFRSKLYLCEGQQITAQFCRDGEQFTFTEKARFAVALGVDEKGIIWDETSGPPISAIDGSELGLLAVFGLLGLVATC